MVNRHLNELEPTVAACVPQQRGCERRDGQRDREDDRGKDRLREAHQDQPLAHDVKVA